jgi:hypothetical protein
MHTFRKFLPEEGSNYIQKSSLLFWTFFDNGKVIVNSIDITHIQPLSRVCLLKWKILINTYKPRNACNREVVFALWDCVRTFFFFCSNKTWKKIFFQKYLRKTGRIFNIFDKDVFELCYRRVFWSNRVPKYSLSVFILYRRRHIWTSGHTDLFPSAQVSTVRLNMSF